MDKKNLVEPTTRQQRSGQPLQPFPMNDDILISFDHVSKKFCKDLKRSLWYGLKDVGLSLNGNVEHHNRLRKDDFWAVYDVSFEVRMGECLKQKTRLHHQ